MTHLRARGWGWRYATRLAWAVRGLDLDIERGERVLLLGGSGGGKSTLLRALAGLLDPEPGGDGDEEGELRLDGAHPRATRLAAVAAGRAAAGMLLQDPDAQTVLARVGDDVAFGLENHAVARGDIWPRVDAALEAVGLGQGRGHATSALSGGERQRLALAGVLALRPDLLLLDEPSSMLDPDGARQVRDAVARAVSDSDATVVMVEHRVATWLDLVDRVVVLDPAGGARADGTPAQVLRDQGPQLAREGVWVPGPPPPTRARASQPGATLLRAQGLRVARARRVVLSGVDLDVREGASLALVGGNGSGKSTLALALAGLTRPTGGKLTATPALSGRLGPRPHRWSPRELVARIGTVFQDPQHQFLRPTVADELALGPQRLGRPAREVGAVVDDLLSRLGLAHLARANPFTLSGGEQRRLSVATALACRPRVLVLDEPTFGQDRTTWARLVEQVLAQLDAGCAVVAATHDVDLVAALGGDVARLAHGTLRLDVHAARGDAARGDVARGDAARGNRA